MKKLLVDGFTTKFAWPTGSFRDDIHEAFLRFACAIICWRRLHNISNC